MLDYLHHNIKSHGNIQLNSRDGDIRLNTQLDKKIYINNIDTDNYKTFIDVINFDHTFDTIKTLDTNVQSLVNFNFETNNILVQRHFLKITSFEIEFNTTTIPTSFNFSLTFGQNNSSDGFTIVNPTIGSNLYKFSHDLEFWNYNDEPSNNVDLNYSVTSNGIIDGKISRLKINGILEASNPIVLNSIILFN